jgi:hypothetical protein
MPKVSAYVLIKTLPGKEREVLAHLDEYLTTKHKEIVFGGYDIVVRMSADSTDEIQKVVIEKIKSYRDVMAVLVLTCVNVPEKRKIH